MLSVNEDILNRFAFVHERVIQFLKKYTNLNQKINTKHCKMPSSTEIHLPMNKQRVPDLSYKKDKAR